ncbi:MAG: PQQ-binding-like beta-propeller repeat protein [Verrucomicrobiae bacterium]|nr:PQQ-binding-like beta-propeller repeat protein [Verrucomicrobiae bacterium]
MNVLIGILVAFICYVLCPALSAQETNWTQFRGPRGDGVAVSKKIPVKWSESENVKWKVPIAGKAWSSPVVWGNQIWLSSADEDGRRLEALCIDANSGKTIFEIKLFDVEKPQAIHKFNSYASPTPVIEEGRVYITFGAAGTACIDTKSGKVLWTRRDLECNHYRGAGSSPILYRDTLIMHFDGSDFQYLVALDKTNGKTVWKVNRSIDYKDLGADGKPVSEGDFRKAFATPHVAEIDGIPTLISQGSKAIYAYDARTGEEIWRVEERSNYSASNRPLFKDGVIYCTSGWSSGQLLAIIPGKKGEVIDANNPATFKDTQLKILWGVKRNVPKKPGLIVYGGLVFGIDDSGIASCLDSKTGQERWRERIGGNYSASPIFADGKIYFFSEEGKTTVISASDKFEVIGTNQLDGGFMASAAVVGNALILRTKTHLYRIEE